MTSAVAAVMHAAVIILLVNVVVVTAYTLEKHKDVTLCPCMGISVYVGEYTTMSAH